MCVNNIVKSHELAHMLCALIIFCLQKKSVSHDEPRSRHLVTDINSWTSTARPLSLHLFLL